ncbi:MAG: hypothetical protein HC838_11305 [Spirulinaceae cyanobacterium RM2_2_10]|nr:hypothetical protein [Spirulinaceae cyanobacterium RM2_2_10]
MTSLQNTQVDSEIAFDYSTVDPAAADDLRNAAAYINTRLTLSYQLLVEVGHKLVEMREQYTGVFMSWATSEFRVSYDTVTNWMNTAMRLGDLSDGQAALFQTRALYKLSAPSTPDSARQAAQDLAARGEQVDYKTAFILANAPAAIQ